MGLLAELKRIFMNAFGLVAAFLLKSQGFKTNGLQILQSLLAVGFMLFGVLALQFNSVGLNLLDLLLRLLATDFESLSLLTLQLNRLLIQVLATLEGFLFQLLAAGGELLLHLRQLALHLLLQLGALLPRFLKQLLTLLARLFTQIIHLPFRLLADGSIVHQLIALTLGLLDNLFRAPAGGVDELVAAIQQFDSLLQLIRQTVPHGVEQFNRVGELKAIRRAVDESPVYLTNWILQRVARYGTGSSMYRTLDRSINVAGKTGTTDDLRDSWFAGFAANRLAVVWVGRDDNKPAQLTGATGALQLWAGIMADIDPRGLMNVPPEDVVEVPLRLRFDPNGASGNDYGVCSGTTPVPFVRGYVPDGLSDCDSDIMRENRYRREQPQQRQEEQEEGNWLQRLFG